MEAVMCAEAPKDLTAVVGPQKKNRIQVSTNKKPLFFYVNLAKRYMQHHNEIELSALGMAIGTVVTVAEILKNNGLATEKKIQTSTVNNEAKGIRKAKIEILLGKTENFNDLMTASKAGRSKVADEAKDGEAKEKAKDEKWKDEEVKDEAAKV